MRKILLLCNMGLSTSLMVNRMRAAAREENYESRSGPTPFKRQKPLSKSQTLC